MTSEDWTIGSALTWTQGYLDRKGDEHPRQSAEWLLSWVCSLTRIELYMDLTRPLSADEKAALHDGVLRRGKGEPLQYISGSAPFRYLTVKVEPGVLIPRPETEVLVSEALSWLPPAPERKACWNSEAAQKDQETLEALQKLQKEQGLTSYGEENQDSESPKESESQGEEPLTPSPYLLVADICTGTGNIACAIATERPDTRVIATDLSSQAVALAQQNVSQLALTDRVKVLQGNLGDPIPERFLGVLDLVISNPPYIPHGVLATLSSEVTDFEPELALDGGVDGLDCFRALASWAYRALKERGVFACELHETTLDAAALYAQALGFADVAIKEDLAQRPRILLARK